MQTTVRSVGWLSVKPEYALPQPEPVDETSAEERKESKKRKRGQNTNRKPPSLPAATNLCPSYAKNVPCKFGDTCKFCHSLREYMAGKEEDIGNVCPVFEAIGVCDDGWRCRWLSGHTGVAEEGEEGSLDGLRLLVDAERAANTPHEELNRMSSEVLKSAKHDSIPLPRSQEYLRAYEEAERTNELDDSSIEISKENSDSGAKETHSQHMDVSEESVRMFEFSTDKQDHRSTYVETPFRPTEKRKINWSGLHVLAPLTTLGNPPFRRLARSFGAQLTYSEMVLSSNLLQASKSEWALIRAHPTETYSQNGPPNSYYGVQLAGGKIPAVVKTTELLTKLCAGGIDTIDLNCGCPLDMIFKMGAGSALLDTQAKLVKIMKGMVLVTGDVPVTCKIRMGVKDGKNTAQKLLKRLIVENIGVSAVTLHGRSRAQRYSRAADWEYIAECAALIKRTKEEMASVTDASYENLEYGETSGMAFIGNGDIYSYLDFYNAIDKSGVDTSMIARGAIIKPWIFEEIQQRQHIDKSASERLDMLKQFAHWGLEHWGSDSYGVSTTRRFFCEFMSFFHRYVPLGILDHESIPPHLHDRAPRWCGRSELETLLGSSDSRDWVKISEMFLGKTPEGWNFTPKHKSNSVDAEG